MNPILLEISESSRRDYCAKRMKLSLWIIALGCWNPWWPGWEDKKSGKKRRMVEKHRIHFQSKLSDEASASHKLGAQRSRPLTLGHSIHPGSPGKWMHSGRAEAWPGRRVNGRGERGVCPQLQRQQKLMRREFKNRGEAWGREGGMRCNKP